MSGTKLPDMLEKAGFGYRWVVYVVFTDYLV
jgi:hypothetical protein